MVCQGQPNFPALQAALSEGRSEDLIYFAFDLLFLEGRDLRGLGLKDRKSRLQSLLAEDAPHLRFVEHFETSGDAVWQSACRLELEGIVSKRLDSQYRSGRGDAWAKANGVLPMPDSRRCERPARSTTKRPPVERRTGWGSPSGPRLFCMVPSHKRPCGSQRHSLERCSGSASGRQNR